MQVCDKWKFDLILVALLIDLNLPSSYITLSGLVEQFVSWTINYAPNSVIGSCMKWCAFPFVLHY